MSRPFQPPGRVNMSIGLDPDPPQEFPLASDGKEDSRLRASRDSIRGNLAPNFHPFFTFIPRIKGLLWYRTQHEDRLISALRDGTVRVLRQPSRKMREKPKRNKGCSSPTYRATIFLAQSWAQFLSRAKINDRVGKGKRVFCGNTFGSVALLSC